MLPGQPAPGDEIGEGAAPLARPAPGPLLEAPRPSPSGPRRVCPTCGSGLVVVAVPRGAEEHRRTGLLCPACGPVARWGVLDARGRLVAAGSLDVIVVAFELELRLEPVAYGLPVSRSQRRRLPPPDPT